MTARRVSHFRLMSGGDGNAVGGTMNGEGDHHSAGDFTVAMRGGFVEVAGGAGGTNVINVFSDQRKTTYPEPTPEEGPTNEAHAWFREQWQRGSRP